VRHVLLPRHVLHLLQLLLVVLQLHACVMFLNNLVLTISRPLVNSQHCDFYRGCVTVKKNKDERVKRGSFSLFFLPGS
jgi:hypothetical protein